LQVLQSKQVDPHLFALVFGESALNDAVALVLFNTLSEFLRSKSTLSNDLVLEDFAFLLDFAKDAIISPILGVFMAVTVALLFHHVDFRHHPMLELPLYAFLMYLPFVIAECFHMSGIVTIFFSGIAARRYVAPNVSIPTAENAETIFQLAAYLAEICIFLELGLSVFGLQASSFNFYFIVWAFGATLLGRAISVYSITQVYNWSLLEIQPETPSNNECDSDGLFRENSVVSSSVDPDDIVPTTKHASLLSIVAVRSNVSLAIPPRRLDKMIPMEYSHFLWFAGLRGAVAYACARKFPNLYGHGDEIVATTMVIVLVTIILMGGCTEFLLQWLEIKMGSEVTVIHPSKHPERQLRESRFSLFGTFFPF
jgi:NhaP-type Na+/H+ or K+/H+ antiporter